MRGKWVSDELDMTMGVMDRWEGYGKGEKWVWRYVLGWGWCNHGSVAVMSEWERWDGCMVV